jgi:hypothetical protein
MGTSGSGTGDRELRDQFNRLVNAQTRDDLLGRIAALQGTESGLMFFDLLGYLRGRIRQDRRYVTAAHPRVILGIEQVETTTIRHLLEEPKQMLVLTGMLASLNTDIWMAQSATCPDALLRHERGYPQEMGEIAAFIDEALDLRTPSAQIRGSTPRSGPVMR